MDSRAQDARRRNEPDDVRGIGGEASHGQRTADRARQIRFGGSVARRATGVSQPADGEDHRQWANEVRQAWRYAGKLSNEL